MFCGSWLGQDIGVLLFLTGRCGRTSLEAEAVIAGFKDVTSVGQAIEQRGSHFGVAEDGGPFAEAEIGCDDDAGALVELAQQVEEQGAA